MKVQRLARLSTRLLLLGGVLTAFVACDLVTGIDGSDVQLRVYNNSDYDFDSLTVNGVYHGHVAPASFSNYRPSPGAYRYGSVWVKVGGRWVRTNPVDFVGETPLRKGRYTYMLSADPAADGIHIHFVDGARLPVGPQEPGRARTSFREDYYGRGIAPHGAGGVVVSGSRRTLTMINPTVSLNPESRVIYLPHAAVGTGSYSMVLAAFDANGNLEWERQMDSVVAGESFLESLHATGDGSVIAVGSRDTHEIGPAGVRFNWARRGVTARFDASGQEVWTRSVGTNATTELAAVSGTSDGGLVAAGSTGYRVSLTRMDEQGHPLWSAVLAREGRAEGVVQLPDGGFAMVGDRHGHTGPGDRAFAARVDADGNEAWMTRFPGSATGVVASATGGLAVAGATHDGLGQLTQLGADGSVQSVHKYGNGRLVDIVSLGADGYAMAGARPWQFFWLVRVDASGNELWQRTYDMGGWQAGAHTIAVMADGGFALVGGVGAGLDVGARLAVVRTDANGELLWRRTLVQ